MSQYWSKEAKTKPAQSTTPSSLNPSGSRSSAWTHYPPSTGKQKSETPLPSIGVTKSVGPSSAIRSGRDASAWSHGGLHKTVDPSSAGTPKSETSSSPIAILKSAGPPSSNRSGGLSSAGSNGTPQQQSLNRVLVASQPGPAAPSNVTSSKKSAPGDRSQPPVSHEVANVSGAPSNSKKKSSPQRVTKPSPQPSKKRKPTLGGSMKISDMVPKNAFTRMKPPPPKGDVKNNELRASDFPALSEVVSLGVKGDAQQRPKPSPPSTMKRNDNKATSTSKPSAIKTKTSGTKRSTHPTSSPNAGGNRHRQAPSDNITGNRLKSLMAKNTDAFAVATLDRDLAGGEHDLLRLVQQGKVLGVPKTGRQRIRPRKKKFSGLKKKVLEERLRRWRELYPETAPKSSSEDRIVFTTSISSTVVLNGFADPDEVEDDDEFEEIAGNLRDMAEKIGQVKRVLIPRSVELWSSDSEIPSFVDFVDSNVATAAVECWNDLVLGGTKLSARVLVPGDGVESPENFDDWKEWCIHAGKGQQLVDSTAIDKIVATAEVALENVLTEDDLEDDECMEESLEDVKVLASKFGELESLRVVREPALCVILSYRVSEKEAIAIAKMLNDLVVGGTNLIARVHRGKSSSDAGDCRGRTVVLSNVLTEDDIEDEDCLQESLDDLRELATHFGSIQEMNADTKSTTVSVVFSTSEEAVLAQSMFNGMVIGGTSISASLPLAKDTSETSLTPIDHSVGDTVPAITTPKTMFSGDKRIPERFAECKSVPKVPNSGKPRNYAILTNNENVKPLLSEMLSELMRLQRRAVEEKNTKAKRRLVMGLREVARGIRSHKVKMVVMANNLDEYGVIDEKLQEIIDLSQKEDVPVFFEFSKRTLGKAIGKSIKVAVIGIQNAEGAHQEFKKLVGLAPTLPEATV